MRSLVVVVSLLVFLASSALARPCTTGSVPMVTTPPTGVSYTMLLRGDGAPHPGVYYLAGDACQPGCVVSLWVYEESNGVRGLQRYDDFRDDTCGLSWWEPDTLVW